MKSRLKAEAPDSDDPDVVSKTRENLGRIGRKADECYEEGLAKARAFERRLEEIVGEYPIRSILVTAAVAAGIGFIAGCIKRKQ